MSSDARDRHAKPPGKRYALVLFSSFFFSGKDQSMNQFLRVFFLSPTKDCNFFSSENTKKVSVSQCLSVSHEEEGRIKKEKKSEEGNNIP